MKETIPGLVIGVAIVMSGCSTPDPHAFQQYAAGVKEAANGLDRALAQDIGWSRDKYIEAVLDGSVNLPHTAILDWKGPFTVTFPGTGDITNQPTFYKLQDARVTMLNLNGAIENYVGLLITLAGSDLVNPDTFDAMAKDTDASLNSIISQLDLQVPGSAIQLFSVGSTEVVKLVIEHRKHDALVRILSDSQPAIDGYSAKCISLLRILDQSLANDYSAKAMSLVEAFSDIPHQNRHSNPKARIAVERLLRLNSDYLGLVKSLRSARSIYEALPQGHRELLKSVQKQPTGLEAIKALYEEGKHLTTLSDQLQQASQLPQPKDTAP